MNKTASKTRFPLNTLLTHAAVFACGAVIVFVAKKSDPDSATAAGSDPSFHHTEDHATASSRASAGEMRTSSGRPKLDAADKGPKGPEAVKARVNQIHLIGDPLERQAALMDLIKRLGPDEFQAVAEQYRSLEHFGNARGEFDLILRGWASTDPLAALQYTTEQLKSGERTALVLSSWAGKDPDAAERWALANHKGDGPNPYLAAVISGIALSDTDRAAQLASTMPRSHERSEAMESISRALMVRGETAAMNFPATVGDPDLRAGFVSIIAERLARRDADKAASWLADMKDPAAQTRAARRIAEELARKDVSGAAAWIGKLSPAAQAEAALGVINPMSSADIAGTAKWVSTLSGIPNYDRVVEEFVWSCDHRAPEQSAAWIRGIADPEQQTRLYHRMLGEWAQRDAGAVKNWVATNSVPPSVAKRFLK